MYTKLMEFLKDYLQTAVTATQIQTGYLGDFADINLQIPAVLLEPRFNRKESHSSRWNKRPLEIRLWVMVEMVRDYMTSMSELEDLLGADDEARTGIHAALDKLKTDEAFRALAGSMGGKAWRIGAPFLEESDTVFGVQQSSSTRINTAQVTITIYIESER